MTTIQFTRENLTALMNQILDCIFDGKRLNIDTCIEDTIRPIISELTGINLNPFYSRVIAINEFKPINQIPAIIYSSKYVIYDGDASSEKIGDKWDRFLGKIDLADDVYFVGFFNEKFRDKSYIKHHQIEFFEFLQNITKVVIYSLPKQYNYSPYKYYLEFFNKLYPIYAFKKYSGIESDDDLCINLPVYFNTLDYSKEIAKHITEPWYSFLHWVFDKSKDNHTKEQTEDVFGPQTCCDEPLNGLLRPRTITITMEKEDNKEPVVKLESVSVSSMDDQKVMVSMLVGGNITGGHKELFYLTARDLYNAYKRKQDEYIISNGKE